MTDEPALQLYAYWRSMAAYRVRVALNLKGIRAQEIPVNLEAGEQLAPEFLAVNPEGAVPALIEPGQPPLTQSTAILEYLDERFPTAAAQGFARPGAGAVLGGPDRQRYASYDRAACQALSGDPCGVRGRGLARLGDQLGEARRDGHGNSTRRRSGDRRFLPWRPGDDRRYLPGQSRPCGQGPRASIRAERYSHGHAHLRPL
jgi:glutathione S-transferase-like protein